MKHEQNKAIVRGYLNELVNKGNLSAFESYFSEDVVLNNSIKDVKQFIARTRAINKVAFPDQQLTIEDQIAEGDKVVTRVSFQGTHQGEFNGIAPTGKQVKYSGMAMDRIANGKVVEMWHMMNIQELLRQLGATPSPAPKK